MTIDLRRSVRTYVTLADDESLNEIVDGASLLLISSGVADVYLQR